VKLYYRLDVYYSGGRDEETDTAIQKVMGVCEGSGCSADYRVLEYRYDRFLGVLAAMREFHDHGLHEQFNIDITTFEKQ
jgi:hypothetical protein